MVSRNLLIALLSILCFGGIIAWQLQHLGEMKQLREEIFQQQAEGKLKELATKLRTSSVWGQENFPTANLSEATRKKYISDVDSLLQLYIPEEEFAVWWGLVLVGERDSLLLSNAPSDKQEAVLQSKLSTCLSCLILVSFPDSGEELVLEHSIAQMRMMSGKLLEEKPLKYFTVYSERKAESQWPDYVAFLFLSGLSALFGISLYLNARQKRLIEQKNEFINHLSHQFKTPLASIRLGTKMLLNAPQEDKNREMLQLIDLEGKRLDKHIQTVLQWVRAGAQGLQLARQPLDLVTLTQESVRQMEPVFRDRQAQVEIQSEERLPQAMVDEYHLILVYFNLWENALKHNSGPLRLNIDICRQGNFLLVKHQDNGKGFSYIANKQRKANQQTNYTGLGLLYVERVMAAHGGAVEIHSKDGEGTLITLKLPLA